jgi:coenzyme F420-0:L-glutamate ligase/coenzyme F420-1:gamma-L-glutamate ligase
VPEKYSLGRNVLNPQVTIQGLRSLPEIKKADPLDRLIVKAAADESVQIISGDVIVVTQKIVSKSEGRTVWVKNVIPSQFAKDFARQTNQDPRVVEIRLRESSRIVRMDRGQLITETRHGFVCANAGVDRSNVPKGSLTLLPLDPDRSAEAIRRGIRKLTGARVAVVITDTFGRAWRLGLTEVAIGVAGLKPLEDYREQRDKYGNSLRATIVAVADLLASAAGLVMNKLEQIPVAIIRGFRFPPGKGRACELLRPAEQDLFR